MLFRREIETMMWEKLLKLRLEQLMQTVKNICANVPLYRDRFIKAGVRPADTKSLTERACAA